MLKRQIKKLPYLLLVIFLVFSQTSSVLAAPLPINGNTVITGHAWNPDNQPGIFIDLRNLRYGDQIRIHAWGDGYTYQVMENRRSSPFMAKSVLEHKDSDWVTLLTREDFGEYWGDYGYRRMVGAAMGDVSPSQ